MTAVLLCVVGAYTVVLALAYRGARNAFHQMTTAWDTLHEYRTVDASDIPEVPLHGYDNVYVQLSGLGFRRVGRLENLAMTKAYPDLRTFADVYVDDSGDVYAASYRVVATAFEQQVVDLESEFEDGSFLLTTNGKATGFLNRPPTIERNTHRGEEEVARLLQAHTQRLDELRRTGGKTTCRIRSLDDIVRAQSHFSELERRHRESVGYLSFDEVRAMGQGLFFVPGSLQFFYWVFSRHVQKHRALPSGPRS